jgi:hypothetical protein
MKKIPKIHFPYISVGILGILTIIICIQIFPLKTTVDLVNFTITFLSLVVAIIAFVIATQTYVSIDSVNVISQMEGNVLENEHYVTSIISLLREYDMKDKKSAGEAMFKNLEEKFRKKPKTAIEFTNHLQYFIDLIVLFPSLFHADGKYEQIERMNKLLQLVDTRKKELLAISTGNLILVEETVKLIKCVINYQKLIHTNDYKIASSLLEVRGSMLKNSVTQTVYYNYLGLFYNKKAMNILRRHFPLGNKDIFDIHILQNLINDIDSLDDEDVELYTIYLSESRKAFKKALENCQDDMMWEGFIKYNDARSTFFLQLVSPEYNGENNDWEVIMNEAIIARSKLNILIKDTLDKDYYTHLQTAFIYQEYLARLVKTNLLIAEKKDLTDTIGKAKYMYPHYSGLVDDTFIKEPFKWDFEKINDYQMKLRNYENNVFVKNG